MGSKPDKTIEDYKVLAQQREFVWMGTQVVTTKTKTTWQCINMHVWQAPYNNIQQGHNCPYCTNKALKVSADYKSLALDKGFEWLGPEVNGNKKTTSWQCSLRHVWQASYNDIWRGRGCPYCVSHVSKPEIQLREAVLRVYPDTQGNVRKLLKSRGLELDIYIPSLKKAVEYDGWAHSYYPAAKARDLRKNQECIEAGIKLLRIQDEEYRHDPQATTQRVLQWLTRN